MSYISSSDITDSIAKQFVTASDSRVATWLSRTDSEIESIAQEKGVSATLILATLHYKVKEYAICYYCFLCFQDVFTTNNIENTEQEKHRIKLEWYEKRCNALRPLLTAEMFTTASASLTAAERVGCGTLWRG